MHTLPIGTERIWTCTSRKKPRQQRYIKVSHHGNWRRRWRPYSSHWWEQNIGPIPEGYQVFHADGKSLNDNPDNLILAREDRFRIIFATCPDASRRQMRNRSRAVIRSNRRRRLVSRFRIRPKWWYIVLPASKAIVWWPCATEVDARKLPLYRIKEYSVDNRELILNQGGKCYRYVDPIEYVRGAEVIAESKVGNKYDGFVRLVRNMRAIRR